MVTKFVTALIVLGLGAKAFEVPFNLDEKIKEGQEKILSFSKQSDKEISVTEKFSAEYKDYFNKSTSFYISAGDASRLNLTLQLNEMTKKYVGEAIDKNKNTNTFENIVKAKVEADTTITDSKNSAHQCANDVCKKGTKELKNVDLQISYIKASTAGLYQQLKAVLSTCTDENSINKVVQTGERRLNNLKNILQSFNDKLLLIRSQHNQNQDNCLRNNQNGNQNAFKTAENKMKFS